jgi:hypothetical protein
MNVGWYSERNIYKVEFDFINSEGKVVHADLDRDGEGFTLEDALYVQHQLKQQPRNRNVVVKQIKESAACL